MGLSSDSVYCLHCGARTERALYCSHCGGKLAYSQNEPEALTRKCPSCSSTIPRAAKSCSNCNAYLPCQSAGSASSPSDTNASQEDRRSGDAPSDNSPMVACPHCGNTKFWPRRVSARRCGNSSREASPVVCDRCGMAAGPGDEFCSDCGTALDPPAADFETRPFAVMATHRGRSSSETFPLSSLPERPARKIRLWALGLGI